MLVALVLHYGNGRVLRVYSLPLKMLNGAGLDCGKVGWKCGAGKAERNGGEMGEELQTAVVALPALSRARGVNDKLHTANQQNNKNKNKKNGVAIAAVTFSPIFSFSYCCKRFMQQKAIKANNGHKCNGCSGLTHIPPAQKAEIAAFK